VTFTALRPDRGRSHRDEPTTGRASRALGQSLVEFSLLLPVLLLLVVAALDFGRIYLGYINIQNMARIAANEAANNPEAWTVLPDTAIQAKYRNGILEDSSASNCALPVSGGQPVIPDPIFTDMNGDGVSTGLGDKVTVRLTCDFTVATPLIANILGNQIEVTAESDFPVKAGMTAVVAEGAGSGGGGTTSPPVSGFSANSSVFSAVGLTGTLTVLGPDVAVDFRDGSGGGTPTEWAWTVSDGATYTAQDVVHTFHCPSPDPVTNQCQFWVQLVASNTYGASAPATMYVNVAGATDINFTADRQVIDRGQTVTFTSTSTAGGTNFAWTFGDGTTQSGSSGTVTHTYTSIGVFTVSLEVTYPVPPPGGSTATKTNYITVNAGMCPVPSLTDVRYNDADAVWRAAPYSFLGHVLRANGANNANFIIKSQSIAGGAGAYALCTSNIYVSDLAGYFTP
jgi:PKD repeat protein